jgi:hypothetical protein
MSLISKFANSTAYIVALKRNYSQDVQNHTKFALPRKKAL